jgi:hypothetical protein
MVLLWQFGGDLYNEDTTKATFNSEAGVEALEWMVSLIKKGYSPKNVAQDAEFTAFQNGNNAFMWNGIWNINPLNDVDGLDWGVSPMPRIGTEKATWAGSHHFAIMNKRPLDENKVQASKVFINWVSQQSIEYAKAGQIPARKSVRESQAFKNLEEQSTLAEQLPYVHFTPTVPGIADVAPTTFDTAVNEALLKDGAPRPRSTPRRAGPTSCWRRTARSTRRRTCHARDRATPRPAAAGQEAARQPPETDGREPPHAVRILAPYLLLFLVFIVIPAVFGIWMSLHTWDPLLPAKPWVGLQNYTDLFSSNSTTAGPFWNSMEATGKFTLYSVPLLVVIPLLHRPDTQPADPWDTVSFRAIYFAPYVLGVAVIGICGVFCSTRTSGSSTTTWARARDTLDHGAAVGLGLSGGGDRVVDARVQRRDLPGGPPGYRPRALQRGQGGRREPLAEVRQRDHAGLEAGLRVRRDGDDPGLGQHVRPVVHHHAGCPRRGDDDGDHVHRRGGAPAVQHGRAAA